MIVLWILFLLLGLALIAHLRIPAGRALVLVAAYLLLMGSADAAVIEARDQMLAEDLPTDYLRVRAYPFSQQVKEFIRSHERTYVVELNRDGQLKQLLTLDNPELATYLIQVSHLDGLPLTARWIREQIMTQEAK